MVFKLRRMRRSTRRCALPLTPGATYHRLGSRRARMPKLLTREQIEQFERDGFVSPVRVMSESDAATLRRRLEEYEAAKGGPLAGAYRHKSHLLFTWLADLVRHERILDAVEDLYGPNLLCWTTNFFIKEKAAPAFVSWHQ